LEIVKIGFHPPAHRYVLRRCVDCAAVALVVVWWCGVLVGCTWEEEGEEGATECVRRCIRGVN